MTQEDAARLLQPAIHPVGGTWADLGAGTGLFTRALAQLLGPQGRVLAVDRDAQALSPLRGASREGPDAGAPILTVEGDFERLHAIEELAGVLLDGVLFANALHFAPDPVRVLRDAGGMLRDSGRIVLVEYDRRHASPWVPFPVAMDSLPELAAEASLAPPRVLSRRPSAYGGVMYCAVLERMR